MRQRVRPKLGKIDIDYQKLHDAFFRYQTKPKMSRHGDIYYEVSLFEDLISLEFSQNFFLKFSFYITLFPHYLYGFLVFEILTG